MATKTSSDTPTFALPAERPVTTEQIEADLRTRITTCEEALENALWQLARFYSTVGRQEEAAACVDRCNAGTRDLGKQAARYLVLGSEMEKAERYADAEAMYGRGLEIQPVPSEVRYFLLNNRGYCLNLLGRHTEAEFHTRAAIAVDPVRHNAHKNLGLALAGQGHLMEAAHCLLEADRRCPGDTRARRHLADLLAEDPEILKADPALAAVCRDRGIRPGRVGSA
jgi:tetratricopeptide (TPR) repeat protein